MLILKKKYYLFIENTREFNLNLIKIKNKFNIIYRNQTTKEKIQDLKIYRKNCKRNSVNFFVANDIKLLSKINADGLYISAHNKNLRTNVYSRKGFKIIGSAHNQRELDLKIKQGCNVIIFSRLLRLTVLIKQGI